VILGLIAAAAAIDAALSAEKWSFWSAVRAGRKRRMARLGQAPHPFSPSILRNPANTRTKLVFQMVAARNPLS
jgi:hypothetical protein